MKVLVIDDDPDVAEVISLCFEKRGPAPWWYQLLTEARVYH